MPSFAQALSRPIPGEAIQGVLVLGAAAASFLSATDIAHGTVLGWIAELAVSFLPLALVVSLLTFRTPRRTFLATVGTLLGLCLFASPFSLPAASGKNASVTIVSANLAMRAADPALFEQWAKDADFVVLLELTPSAARDIAALERWPHKVLVPEDSPFGIGLLSRFPLTVHPTPKDSIQPEVIRAVATTAIDTISLVAIHPMPPISPAAHAQRDALIEREASWLQTQPRGLMIGDLNTTPWGSALHKAAQAGLRRAHTWSATWPTPLTHVGLGIGIDHILGNVEEWCVRDADVGTSTGSDHAPIRATLEDC